MAVDIKAVQEALAKGDYELAKQLADALAAQQAAGLSGTPTREQRGAAKRATASIIRTGSASKRRSAGASAAVPAVPFSPSGSLAYAERVRKTDFEGYGYLMRYNTEKNGWDDTGYGFCHVKVDPNQGVVFFTIADTMEYLYLTITPTLVMLHEQNFGKDKINHFAVWKCDLDGGLVEFCCQIMADETIEQTEEDRTVDFCLTVDCVREELYKSVPRRK